MTATTAEKPADKPKDAAKAADKPKSGDGAAAPATEKKKMKRGRPRNYDLGNGIYRFSRSRMLKKKAIYKFINKKNPSKPKVKKPLFVIKPIGGEKNGGKRVVWLRKRKNYYPTQDRIKKHPAKKCFRQHKRHLRSSLTPGTVCILLAGPHKGKRVVFLKQLRSGLLLITGPFRYNACPMRRINQIYVIGTRTRIDISEVKMPDTINDKYFRREKKKRTKKVDGDIFTINKQTYKASEQRKKDQQIVDDQVVAGIKKHPDKKMLYRYFTAMFGLKSSQFPHRMKF